MLARISSALFVPTNGFGLAWWSSKAATIAILDQYSNVKGSAFVKSVASLIGWNLFLFAGGCAYDIDDVKKWLEGSGFRSTVLTHLRRSPGFSLIAAHKH
jgi:hypothetical protein